MSYIYPKRQKMKQ